MTPWTRAGRSRSESEAEDPPAAPQAKSDTYGVGATMAESRGAREEVVLIECWPDTVDPSQSPKGSVR
jgi:hypothetical protein